MIELPLFATEQYVMRVEFEKFNNFHVQIFIQMRYAIIMNVDLKNFRFQQKLSDMN